MFPHPGVVHEIFEDSLRRNPRAGQVRFLDAAVSHAQINSRANQMARWLLDHGVGRGDLVAVCFEPCVELIVALLAVLKTGAAFVPLDPALPRERLEFVARDCAAKLLLCNDATEALCPDRTGRMLNIDASADAIAGYAEDNPRIACLTSDVIYVMYTSGSTGMPKGAILTHAGIRNRLLWGIEAYELGIGASVLFKTPISFDVCIWEIFAPLLCGADLVIAKQGGARDIPYLIDLIDRHRVTHADFVPSMMSVFMSELEPGACDSLRVVTCAGETLTAALLDQIFARLDVRVYNLYGPTEASLAVTWWSCTRTPKDREIPIGQPMANVALYILDERGRIAPEGESGELYIGGVAPGIGYINQPVKAADSFVPDPFSASGTLYRTGDLVRLRRDGSLMFLGRVDQQVKLRGMRIELGEIEAQVAAFAAVRDAVVLVRHFGSDDERLVAYITLREPIAEKSGFQSFHERCRTSLRQMLPETMVPAHFVIMPAMPLTTNGKADRKALLALPVSHDTVTVRPGSDSDSDSIDALERRLTDVWRDVLGVADIDRDRDFFSLGGHSLLAVKVVARLKPDYRLTVAEVFEHRTIEALAALLRQRSDAE
ncbi:amino acid adenylation protein [Caballeronia catudaia]|uniref:Amino acid adenylation protein n=1 Tax=Caballeronia catudaia TaxID=1777136 RepID=A0A157ZZZ4_9BURK|nr:non-ribosomal peptide synthetase [Caballeronia catudaia]SAK51122.1 amino acid adenylation protein [Caballeronia catudaia]